LFAAGAIACSTGTIGCTAASARPGFDTSPTDPAEKEGGESEDTPAQPERPGCAKDQYTEALPTKASLSRLEFSPSVANDYLVAALEARFPLGAAIVRGGLESKTSEAQGSCIDRFLEDTSSASAVLRQAATVVHECGHFFDLGESRGSTSTYVIRPGDLQFSCKAGDTTERGGKTFARSLIKNDAHYAKRKACGGKSSLGCDFYADTYLNGDATDGTFDSGDQGYNLLLEEATQYVNSLATALAFEDQYQRKRVSERDGILTFLWYIERYLAMARTEHPEAYELLSGDPCWRQATLTVWDRGWFYLSATAGKESLGLDDKAIEELVTDPELVAEIDALRELECK
jgi:hypothetical protein